MASGNAPSGNSLYFVILGAVLIAEVSYAVTGSSSIRVGIAAGGVMAAFVLASEASSSQGGQAAQQSGFAPVNTHNAGARCGDGFRCPKGHPLELRRISGRCDACHKFVCGTTVGCTYCGWDLCGDCHPLAGGLKRARVRITIQSLDAVVGDERMDPFVEVMYAGNGTRTTVKRNAGRKAEWNETIGPVALVPGMALTCAVQDFDKAKGSGVKTEHVGSTRPLPLESLTKNEHGAWEGALELLGADGVGHCGELRLKIENVVSFDGLWSTCKGHLHVIDGDICSNTHGDLCAFATTGERRCALEFRGGSSQGMLSADGLSIEWRDADVWSRVQLASLRR